MTKTCPHAASGCDYPASECAGHCASKQQPEALRLAARLDPVHSCQTQLLDLHREAAAELRRLHAENQQLRADLEAVGAGGVGPLIPTTVQHQHKLSNDNDLQRENGHLITSSSIVPAGWKLVPVEPTDDMLYDIQEFSHILPPRGKRIWAHMLAAAPQLPVVEQPQVEQEPAPNGATHRQPKQGAFYKRVDGKWYVWSRMENGEPHRWYISPGTSESCLEPLNAAAPQPKREPLTDAQINGHRLALPYNGEDLPDPWDFKQGVRAAERAHRIGGAA